MIMSIKQDILSCPIKIKVASTQFIFKIRVFASLILIVQQLCTIYQFDKSLENISSLFKQWSLFIFSLLD